MRDLRNSKSGSSNNPAQPSNNAGHDGWFIPNQQQEAPQQKTQPQSGNAGSYARRPGNYQRRPMQGNVRQQKNAGNPGQQQRPQQSQNRPYNPQTPPANSTNPVGREDVENILSNMSKEQQQQFEHMKNNVSQYEGKSEQELLKEVQRLAMKGRQQGELNNASLDSFANMLSPMLNDEQKKRLGDIISQLKQ